jgi:hypothetical protein
MQAANLTGRFAAFRYGLKAIAGCRRKPLPSGRHGHPDRLPPRPSQRARGPGWDDIDFQTGKLHVRRAKGARPAFTRSVAGAAPCRLKREALQASMCSSVSAWHPLSVAGYQRMVARAGEPRASASSFTVTCCGIPAATSSQTMADTRTIRHYLGHKSINSTVRYMALAPDRFKGF